MNLEQLYKEISADSHLAALEAIFKAGQQSVAQVVDIATGLVSETVAEVAAPVADPTTAAVQEPANESPTV